MDAVEPRNRELLEQWPQMPSTVIAGRIGPDRGPAVLGDPGGATGGARATVRRLPLGFGQVGRPPVLVMVAGCSRWIAAGSRFPGRRPGLIDRREVTRYIVM
ncbi:hypothetical protein [Streptomyces fungicidicus]